VNVETVMDDFSVFLRNFSPRRDEGRDDAEPYYVRALRTAAGNGTALDINSGTSTRTPRICTNNS